MPVGSFVRVGRDTGGATPIGVPQGDLLGVIQRSGTPGKTECPKSDTFGVVRPVIFHPKARDEIRRFSQGSARPSRAGPVPVTNGESLGMPNARPMAAVASGVWELRVRDEGGIFRVFCYTASVAGVLVFHAFAKKTQRTPAPEIDLARKRLKELLDA